MPPVFPADAAGLLARRVVMARTAVREGELRAILDRVRQAIARWPEFAQEAGVSDETASRVQKAIDLVRF